MKALHFQQITDDRFEDDIENRLIERNRLLRERLNVKGILSLDITEPRLLRFVSEADGGKQYDNQFRSDYRITKDRSITWNAIYGLINSIHAVPYKSVK